MLRVLFLVLVVSGVWATWKSVADWRTAESAQISASLGHETGRRAEIVFGVPSELMSPGGWADIVPRVEAAPAQDATKPERVTSAEATQTASLATDQPNPLAEPTTAAKKPATGTAATLDMPEETQLAAAIQTELKTLGLYRGSVDNIWGRRSRSAVAAFNASEGAALDLEPSVALYTAVKTAAVQRQNTTTASSAPSVAPSVETRADVKTASYLPPASFRGSEKASVNAAGSRIVQPRPRVYRAKRERAEPARRQAMTWRRERTITQQLRNNGIAWPGFF
jgi:hypothetical protein